MAAAVLVIGVLVTALALTLGYTMPPGTAAGIAFGLLLAARGSVKALQGAAVEQHIRNGGNPGSKWAASVVGMGVLAVIAAGYVCASAALDPKIETTFPPAAGFFSLRQGPDSEGQAELLRGPNLRR